jgi:hypothetical protein
MQHYAPLLRLEPTLADEQMWRLSLDRDEPLFFLFLFRFAFSIFKE